MVVSLHLIFVRSDQENAFDANTQKRSGYSPLCVMADIELLFVGLH
jgi:hypothetical protein